jgi:hypothetical protein
VKKASSRRVKAVPPVEWDLRLYDPSPFANGSASVAPEGRERADHVNLNGEAKRQPLAPKGKRALEGKIATLLAEHATNGATIARISSKDREREAVALDKVAIGRQHDTTQSKRKQKEGKRA